jgi:hypothetical protein
MEYGSTLETHGTPTNSTSASAAAGNNGVPTPERRGWSLKRTMLFVGIAAASAGLAYAVVRATLARPPQDPTTERIQSLIDEANKLLKQLDEKKSG